WEMGWVIGPLVSGFVQERYGFGPLFIATAVLYASGVGMIWYFFRDYEPVGMEEPVMQTS
ncbi:MAG: MFS transporter, partial [Deltaproteobacteria bacterium]|nr:MFS transporter [Deltaproteobacteria bacterium]